MNGPRDADLWGRLNNPPFAGAAPRQLLSQANEMFKRNSTPVVSGQDPSSAEDEEILSRFPEPPKHDGLWPNIKAMRHHLEYMFGGLAFHPKYKTGHVEITTRDGSRSKFFPLDKLNKAAEYACKQGEEGKVYINAGLIRADYRKVVSDGLSIAVGHSGADGILCFPCLWGEADHKHLIVPEGLTGQDRNDARLRAFLEVPRIGGAEWGFVHSTGTVPTLRVQGFIRLDEPAEPDDPAFWQSVKALARVGKLDTAATNRSQLLRLSGSLSRPGRPKADEAGEAPRIPEMVTRIDLPLRKFLKLKDVHAALDAAGALVVADAKPGKADGARPAVTGQTKPRLVGWSWSAFREAVMRVPNPPELDRAGWIKILQGIHHESQGSGDGLQLALEWSALHASFDIENTERAFFSMDADAADGTSGATILGAAGIGVPSDLKPPSTGEAFGNVADEPGDAPVDPFIDIRAALATADLLSLDRAAYDAMIAPKVEKAEKPKRATAQFLSQITAQPLPTVTQIVKGVLTAGEIVVAAGLPAAGKSVDLMHLAFCVATGQPYHGRKTKLSGVVYVGSENASEDRRRILASVKHYSHDVDAPFLHQRECATLWNEHGRPTNYEAGIIAMAKYIETKRGVPCRLIIVDNLRRVVAPGTLNDEADATLVMKSLERIRDATGAAVIAIHHMIRDGSRYSGSGAIESHADSVWRFTAPQPKGKGAVIPKEAPSTITFDKLRLGDKRQELRYRFGFEVVAHDDDGDEIRTVVALDAGSVSLVTDAEGLGEVDEAEMQALPASGQPAVAAEPAVAPDPRTEAIMEAARTLAADGRPGNAPRLADAATAILQQRDRKAKPIGDRSAQRMVTRLIADKRLILVGTGKLIGYAPSGA